jgi:V/A-type H+-transporting ATPase subunit E
MTLDSVEEDIREEARARADEIREEAEARAGEIVAEAEDEAEQLREQREREAEATVDQERERKISSAKLEAKQNRLEARRDALESVRAAVEERIAGLEGDRREELTRALLDDAAQEFGDEEAVYVYGRADDQTLLADVLGDYDGFEWAGERDCLGGVVVEGDDSQVRINDTFDSILEAVWEDDLKDISTKLFEDQ